MELTAVPRDVTHSIDELRMLAEICLLRLPIREAESRRAARMRTVVAAAADLTRALGDHTHCMLVNCQGSHGAGDLALETERLHVAFAAYCEALRSVTKDHRRLLESQEEREVRRRA